MNNTTTAETDNQILALQMLAHRLIIELKDARKFIEQYREESATTKADRFNHSREIVEDINLALLIADKSEWAL
jgi:flagellin-specific chaperone FliS